MKTPRGNRDKLRRILAVLQEHLPARRPVRLIIRELRDEGRCTSNPSGSVIVVRDSLPYTGQCDTLLHEYAHALRYDEKPTPDHDDRWGTLFARVFRTYEKHWLST